MAVDTYVVVVTCIIFIRSPDCRLRALILKRSSDETYGPGLWTIPGGKVERSDWGCERPTENIHVFEGVLDRATIREVYDETGIVVRAADILSLNSKKSLVFERNSGTPTMVHRVWTLFEKEPRVILNNEAVASAWITSDEIKRYQFIGNVGDDIAIAFGECIERFGDLYLKT